MAKQRYINTHFWDDSYIKKLEIGAKFLFIYLLTSPLANIAGAYEITIERICFDTGLEYEKVIEYLAEFERAEKIFFKNDWILIQNFLKNQSINPSIEKGIVRFFNCCPDWIKERLYTACQSLLQPATFLNLNINLNTNTNTKKKRMPKTTEAKASSVSSFSQSKGVKEVFEYWQTTLNYPKAKLDDTRAKRIQARLKKFTVDELKTAIANVKADEWWSADLARHELKVIMRDDPQIEKFLAMETAKNTPPPSDAGYIDTISGGMLV